MCVSHSLFDPETTPANGEVSASEASSSVRCTVPSRLARDAEDSLGACAVSLSSFCWWVEAELV